MSLIEVNMMASRYRLTPQMKIYDEMPLVLFPYTIKTSKPEFSSDTVNTDANGFRLSYAGNQCIDSQSWWSKDHRGIVLGGSTAFGVGATHDCHTFVSALNEKTGCNFLNLGIRSGNSTQELIASIPFLAESEHVVIFSGVNTLWANAQSIGKNGLYGPLFQEEILNALAIYSITEVLDRVRNPLRYVGFRELAKVTSRMSRGLTAKFMNSIRRNRPSREKGYENSDFESALETAFDIQKRDLSMVSNSMLPGSQLLFVAQPLASTCRREFTQEEKKLFAILDELQPPEWKTFLGKMTELWMEYVKELRLYCEQADIRFIDSSKLNLTGWCFVDRVHMTDKGYKQMAESVAGELRI